MSVNLTKSHHIYFIHLNTVVCQKGSEGFSRLSEGSVAQNSLRTLWVRDFFNTRLSVAERAGDMSLFSKCGCSLNTLYSLLLLVPFRSQNVTD